MRFIKQIIPALGYKAYMSWKEKDSILSQRLAVVGWGLFHDSKNKGYCSVELLVVNPNEEGRDVGSILSFDNSSPTHVFTVIPPDHEFTSSTMEFIRKNLELGKVRIQ